jgi:hypothetical protein
MDCSNPSIAPSVISACAGLIGVALGGWIAYFTANRKEQKRILIESRYLAILVIADLDRFVDSCAHIAYDDGTCNGQSQGAEFRRVTTALPIFEPHSLEVDWKVMPADLMYEILDLPHKVEQLTVELSNEDKYEDWPDFPEFFFDRRYGFAMLGLEASAITKKLRKYANLPEGSPIIKNRDREDLMKDAIDSITTKRAELDTLRASVANSMQN